MFVEFGYLIWRIWLDPNQLLAWTIKIYTNIFLTSFSSFTFNFIILKSRLLLKHSIDFHLFQRYLPRYQILLVNYRYYFLLYFFNVPHHYATRVRFFFFPTSGICLKTISHPFEPFNSSKEADLRFLIFWNQKSKLNGTRFNSNS